MATAVIVPIWLVSRVELFGKGKGISDVAVATVGGSGAGLSQLAIKRLARTATMARIKNLDFMSFSSRFNYPPP